MIYTLGCDEEFIGIEKCERADIYEYFRNSPLSIDIETSGKDVHQDRLISIQFGDKNNQFFVDCRTVNILEFKELIEGKECLAHNGKFEYKFLKKAGIMMENIWDTMLAECVLYAGYDKWGYGLSDLVRRYLGIEMEKETRNSFLSVGDRSFNERQIRYGCLDVTYLDDIRGMQEQKIWELGLEYCVSLENQCVKALADIEMNGMGFNPKAWLEIASQTQLEAQGLKEKLDDIVLTDGVLGPLYKPEYVQGDLFGASVRELSINYASPAQILKITHQLGFKDVDSTDEQHLLKLKKEHPFFQFLLELRGKNKIISTYGENFLHYISPITNRIHTSFWQCQSTGRTSSGSKRDDTPNVQNIPSENRFRNCFIAREGYSWIEADFAGQELSIMTDRSGEPVFIEALNNKEDIHSNSASLLYGKKITKKDKKERDAAKTITFGLCYGMAFKKLATSLEISEDEAKDLLDRYEKAFPTVMKWLNRAGLKAKREEKAVTEDLCKRIRWFPDMKIAKELRKKGSQDWKTILTIEGATEREGKNHPVQGSGANVTKESLVAIRQLVKEYNEEYGEETAFLICQVHDSIECEVKKPLAKQFSEDMAQAMRECGNKYVSKVKMEVDVSITEFWTK